MNTKKVILQTTIKYDLTSDSRLYGTFRGHPVLAAVTADPLISDVKIEFESNNIFWDKREDLMNDLKIVLEKYTN